VIWNFPVSADIPSPEHVTVEIELLISTTIKPPKGTEDFLLKDFAMQVTMGMDLDDYTEKGKKSKAYEMAARAYAKFGIKPKRGNSYHYVKVNGGYELYQLTSKEEIDIKYYREKAENIIELMQAEYDLFEPIGSYFGENVSEWDEEEEAKISKKENQPASLGDFL